MNGKAWTERERAILRREYPHLPTAPIAAKLGRELGHVYAQAHQLGLHKTRAFHANAKASGRFTKLSTAGIAHRYPKGHVPANKGLRRPGYSVGRGRMQQTQFKKGQRPPNTMNLGDTRVNADGYLDRKVAATGYGPTDWKGVHRLLWIEHYGPIPKGHVVTFKDGNKKPPILLGNLELMTQADNARRNTMWARYPRDLALAISARSALNRKIRRKERDNADQNDHRPAGEAVRHDRRAESQRGSARRRPGPRRRPGREQHYREREGRG